MKKNLYKITALGIAVLGYLVVSDYAYNGTVPQTGLELMWETNNKANQIFNTTKKDDSSTNLLVIEKEGVVTYALPHNKLYVVATEGKFKVSISLTVPAGERDKWICAAYDGDAKVASSDAKLPATAHAPATMEISDPGTAVKDYEIKAGYDANNNNLLDPSEATRLFVYTKNNANGTAVNESKYATVRGISNAKYQANRADVVRWTTGTLKVGVKFAVPHGHALLTRFIEGQFTGVDDDLKPDQSTTDEEFDAFKDGLNSASCFSEWLTHNSGAAFSDIGKVNIQKLTWVAGNKMARFFTTINPLALRKSTSVGSGPTLWTYEQTTTGSHLQGYYEVHVKTLAEADLASKSSWEWYYSPWCDYSQYGNTILTTLSTTAASPPNWPLSTVCFGDTGNPNLYRGDIDAVIGTITGGDDQALKKYDALISLGRARVSIQYQFQVRREPHTLDDGYDCVVKKIWSSGIVEDLYDFNFEDGDPPTDSLPSKAATVQIGSGNGSGGITMPSQGHIYREKFLVDRQYLDPFVVGGPHLLPLEEDEQ